MIFRKDARRMAAALDKARELSRKEPQVDWSEAEWKRLMATAVAQKIVGKEDRKEPRRRAAYGMPALAYGGAALIMMAIIGYALRNSFLRPAASPEPYAQADRKKDMSPASRALETAPPGSAGGIAKPSEADAAKAFQETAPLDARAKKEEAAAGTRRAGETGEPKVMGGIAKPVDAAAAKPAPTVILAGKAAAPGGRARGPAESQAQDTITIRLVSPESGLRIVWVLNRNFEWTGDSQ